MASTTDDLTSSDYSGADQKDLEITTVDSSQYHQMTGEALERTLDVDTWETGVRALQAFERLEREIEEAERQSSDVRAVIREKVFPLLQQRPGAPEAAGVWQATIPQLRATQNNVLFNGLVEACDGNSHVFHTLPMQIIQIAVATITYRGQESTWANRIFRKDIPVRGASTLLDQTLELLGQRSPEQNKQGRRQITDMMRRGLMTYMERVILTDRAKGIWRLGHGNPLAYELLTGSGMPQLVELSVDVLRRLILQHKKFVFVPSETNQEHFLTIGDALNPGEYAIIDTAEASLKKILDGHYTGEWHQKKQDHLDPFCREAGTAVLTGVFRASAMSPAKMFYAHRDYVHEAAEIALADSLMQEHRGCPMLLDLADGLCKTYFGAETLNRPTQTAFAQAGQPYRYLEERSTRPR